MEQKWDGKTKGSLWGYKFFIYAIRFLGVRFAYFFCIGVSGYFLLFSKKPRRALISFYQKGFRYTRWQAIRATAKNLYLFGQTLIDRIALKTPRKKIFSFRFNNEEALVRMNEEGKGGFLFSAHVGNWENAGNLLGERITLKINILMLDAEVQKIKAYLEDSTGKSQYQLIPIKDDLSHLVLIHQALKRNELIALHADRTTPGQKNFKLPFLNGFAEFPAGPFIMAHKFKVPLTFVYAVKAGSTHYELSATDPLTEFESPEKIAEIYVRHLEEQVKASPTQWFNFFEYYVD